MLDNLIVVSQAAGLVSGQPVAGQPRSYAYDSLGRLLTATTPESGTVTNYYMNSDGTACSGDPSLPCRIQDARGVVKTLSYDGMNRPAGATYSDGTPSVTYAYDAGGAAAFALTRQTSITEGSNSQTFTYDNLGRLKAVNNVIDGTTYSVQYAYNLASDLTSITYPTGRVVAQNVDPIGRLSSISDGATYLNNMSYNAAGKILGYTLGNGVQGSFGYNDHLQISSLRYFKNGISPDILNLGYDYGANNNGQIQTVHYYTVPGVEDTTKSENFSYDSWSRLSAAQTTTVNSTPGTWSLQWGYDRLGNRLSQTLTGGGVSIGQPNFQIDPATNHIVGYCYDAAGNLLDEGTCPAGTHQYSYDGANRLTRINAGPPTYTYFGALRIKKIAGTTATVYVYSGSKPIVEYVNGSLSKEYIYAGSKLLATIAGTATTYHHPDHLSNRAETDASGNLLRSFGHFPYGETWYETGTADKGKFTTYERDSATGETGLDYAQHRYYNSGQGRFISPDPLAGHLDAPQSLNRYAYAMNDPHGTDPTGMECVWDDGSFDSEDDPETGSIGSCQKAGGTWIELGMGGAWNPSGNSDLATAILQLQNGDITAIGVTKPDGSIYLTYYDDLGRVAETIVPGLVTGFTYSEADQVGEDPQAKFMADPNGSIARWAMAQAKQFPGPPLDPEDYKIWQVSVMVYQQAGMIGDPRFIACWYAGSTAIGAEGLLAIPAEGEAAADIGVGGRMLMNLGNKALKAGGGALAGACGYTAMTK